MKYYVYLHIRLDSNEIFYVGKGTKRRAFDIKGRTTHWDRIAKKYGFFVNIVAYFNDEQEALDAEAEQIAFYKPFGHLVNVLDAGEGSWLSGKGYLVTGDKNPHFGKKHSEEAKNKISKARKEKYSGENHTRLGTKHSEETIQKLKDSFTEQRRLKISETQSGVKNHQYKGPIIGINIETGEKIILKERKDFAPAGFTIDGIYDCLRKKNKQHRGYCFYRESVVYSD
jgi:hypothetical protein